MSRNDVRRSFNSRIRSEVRQIMDEMEASGALIGVVHPQQQKARSLKSTLFYVQSDADAWCQKPIGTVPKPKASRPDTAARMTKLHAERRAERAAKGIVVRQARQPLADPKPKVAFVPIVTSATKVTICTGATVDRRYQVEPGERIVGCGFSRLKPGQYIAEAVSLAARAVSA
jgi:hypothetical protein